MRYLILPLMLMLCGCGSHVAPQTVSNSVTTVSANLDSAKKNIGFAVPHTDPVGKAYLTSANSNLDSAKEQVPTLEKGAADYLKVSEDLAQHKASFWSDKQKAIGLWIIGGIALLGVLYILGGSSGWIGSIASVVFHTLTLGIGLICTRLRSWFGKPTT